MNLKNYGETPEASFLFFSLFSFLFFFFLERLLTMALIKVDHLNRRV